MVKFFIELSESKTNSQKIKPFEKYKNEFGKTKLKHLNNIIKIAEMVSKGKITFSQHEKFVKKGLVSYEEQYKKIREIENENKNHNKIKKFKMLGKKRLLLRKNNKHLISEKKIKTANNNYNYQVMKDLITSIDEFIFDKRDILYINKYHYEPFFIDLKNKIQNCVLNSTGLNVSNKNIFDNFLIYRC